MADISLEWGDDLGLDPSGDLLLVDGDDMVRQRIERRLFTAVQSYIFHADYGAGLPQRIGRVARERDIQSLVRANIALETTVASVPVPSITVTQDISGLFVIAITYTDAATGTSVSLNFEVPAN